MEILQKSAIYGYLKPIASYLTEHKYATIGGVAALGIVALHQINKSRGLPPGPRGWPILGSSGLLSGPFNELLTNLHKKYGDVVCLWLGGNRYWVILNGYDTIREAYVDRGNDFMDRKIGPIWDYIEFKDGVFTSPYNDSYKANRKFCTQTLRASGFAKEGLEKRLAVEWQELAKAFDECSEHGIDQETPFKWAATNIICGVLFDRALPHGDKDLDEMANAMWQFLDSVMSGEAIQFLPDWLIKITQSNRWSRAKDCTERLTKLVQDIVREHESTYDENHIRDFVDAGLKQGMLHSQDPRHSAHACIAFLPDAVFTTTSMMMFIIMYLMHNPQYQQRMREEVSQVTEQGANGITLNLREKMPFVEAFINEVFRIVTPISTSVPNRPLQTTTLRGYTIPKHFDIMVNIHGVHYNPDTYPEPQKFDPGHFLEKNGKLKRVDQFLPFGIGRRRCMGEQMVRSQLFYFTTNLVMRYEIFPVDGKLPDTTPQESSLAKSHLPFNTVFKKI